MMLSIDLQLQRDQSGSLPYLSHWSRHEPASISGAKRENTDHWAKKKHKTSTMFTTGTAQKTHFYPGDRYPHEIPPPPSATVLTSHHRLDGNMNNIGTRSFTDLLLHELNGNWPGDYYRRTRRPHSHHILRTSANTRARDGFEYWYKDIRPVKQGWKNWIGRQGCVIGTIAK